LRRAHAAGDAGKPHLSFGGICRKAGDPKKRHDKKPDGGHDCTIDPRGRFGNRRFRSARNQAGPP
jgi:hypothetical protein